MSLDPTFSMSKNEELSICELFSFELSICRTYKGEKTAANHCLGKCYIQSYKIQQLLRPPSSSTIQNLILAAHYKYYGLEARSEQAISVSIHEQHTTCFDSRATPYHNTYSYQNILFPSTRPTNRATSCLDRCPTRTHPPPRRADVQTRRRPGSHASPPPRVRRSMRGRCDLSPPSVPPDLAPTYPSP
jgi:hypothetical protein